MNPTKMIATTVPTFRLNPTMMITIDGKESDPGFRHFLADVVRWTSASIPLGETPEAEADIQRGRRAFLNLCPSHSGGGAQEVQVAALPLASAFLSMLIALYDGYIKAADETTGVTGAYRPEWERAVEELSVAMAIVDSIIALVPLPSPIEVELEVELP